MKRKSIIIITAIVLSLSLASCSNQASNTGKTEDNIQTEETQADKTTVLTDYVTGVRDWTVEVNAKNVNFTDGITFDKAVVKEVTADDSKVDLTKEGEYELIYSIVPLDESVEAVTKTVTVNVVSAEKAQEEADSGKQVVTDGGEIKKDSEGNTPKPPKEETTAKPADKPSKPDNKPTEPSKPNNDNSNQGGNDNNQGNKPHTHTWKDVSSTAGDCSHKGKVTQKCACGETTTVDGQYGDHNYNSWVDPVMGTRKVEHKKEVPVYETVGYYKCKKCGAEFDNVNDCADHCMYDCDSRWTYLTKDVQTGTKTEVYYTEEQYEKTPGYWKCSICGKKK